MRILFFAVGDFMEGNGANSRFVCYGKGLNKLQVPNKFFFLVPSEFNSSGINSLSKGYHHGIEFEYLSKTTHREPRLLGRLRLLLKAWWNSFRTLRKEDPKKDVLYFYGPQALILGPVIVLAKFLGFKVIVENTEFQTLRTQESRTLVKMLDRAVSSLFEKNQNRYADRFILISRRLMKFYRLRFPESKMDLLPIIVDPERFKVIDATKKTLRLGYVGSFGHKDGVPGIVRSFKAARVTMPELRLRLIGYQIRTTELQSTLDEEGISIDDPYLEITGQVKAAEIPQLLADCDLLLLNRVNNAYANYGFPTKLAEYLLTSRPVISSDVSDVAHYFNNGEDIKIVAAENDQELTAAILDRYENYELYNDLGKRGRKKAIELFAYPKHVEHLLQVCQDLMKSDGHKKNRFTRNRF